MSCLRRQSMRGVAAWRRWLSRAADKGSGGGKKPKLTLQASQAPPVTIHARGDVGTPHFNHPTQPNEIVHVDNHPPPSDAAKHAFRAHEKAVFATKLGAVVNISLALSKGAIGLSIASTALIADAANSLGDVLGDAVVFYTVTEARKRATPDAPWGRGKFEPIGALSVGALLLGTGVGIGYAAGAVIASMLAEVPTAADLFFSAHPHLSLTDDRGNLLAGLGIAGASVVAKEGLFHYTLAAGKKANSAAVIANAWQHRADVVTSGAVFLGLIGSSRGLAVLDPIAGMLVAGLIIRQGYKIVREALRDLSDAPASASETQALTKTCGKVKGVLSVQELKARKSGPFLFVEATIGVDGTISASAAHRIAELTRLELLREHAGRVANVVVHVNPLGSSGLGEQYPAWARDHDYIVQTINRAMKTVREVQSVSEVQVYYKDNGLIAAKVDIVLSANLTIEQAHKIALKARRVIERALPGMRDIDVDLELEEED